MPLPNPESPRQPVHTRTLRAQSYLREDGLWDIEAALVDVKSYDFPRHGGQVHAAGEPIHDMQVRVTIDDDYNVIEVVAGYDAAPYGPSCTVIAPDYRKLAGQNLLRDFRRQVRALLGRTAGCTHMSELLLILPTVAVQTMSARRRRQVRDGQRPFQLDGCHALRTDGPVVREFYPKWFASPSDPASSLFHTS